PLRSASAVGLRGATQIEARFAEELVFDIEASLRNLSLRVTHQRAEQVRPHAGMQILTDFQCDLRLFRQWRRYLLGDKVLWPVFRRQCGKVYLAALALGRLLLYFYAALFEGFGQDDSRKPHRLGHSVGIENGLAGGRGT